MSPVACPALQYFSTLPHNVKIFEKKKKFLHINCVLISSTTFNRNISHSKSNWAIYNRKCTSVFMYSTRYSCQVLMKLEISRVFWKYSGIKLHENAFHGSRVVPCGRTDGRKERQTWRSQQPLFTILRMSLKTKNTLRKVAKLWHLRDISSMWKFD